MTLKVIPFFGAEECPVLESSCHIPAVPYINIACMYVYACVCGDTLPVVVVSGFFQSQLFAEVNSPRPFNWIEKNLSLESLISASSYSKTPPHPNPLP